MKFCKDCTYIKIPPSGIEYARCTLTMKSTPDPVTGEARDATLYCSTSRMPSAHCGPEATRFVCKACADLEGNYCSEECAAEAAKEHEWMRGKPLSSITGVLSDEEQQDLRDAGRGHLV